MPQYRAVLNNGVVRILRTGVDAMNRPQLRPADLLQNHMGIDRLGITVPTVNKHLVNGIICPD